MFLMGILMFSSVHATGVEKNPDLEKLLSSMPHDSLLVDSINILADANYRYDPSLAFKYGTVGLELADSLGYRKGQASMNLVMSRIYQELGMFERAFEFSTAAMEFHEQLKDSVNLAWSYNGLALIQQSNDMASLAEPNFLKAHAIFKAIEHPHFIPYPLINLGVLYNETGENEKALEVYTSILEEYPDSNNLRRNSALYNNIGNLLLEMENFDSALVMSHQALGMKRRLKRTHNIPSTLNNIANIHIHLGNYDSARQYLDLSRVEARQTAGDEYLLEILQLEAHLEAATKNFEEAYGLLLKHSEKRDSVIRSQHEQKLQEVMGFFELDQKNSEIALLQKDNEIIRNNQRFQGIAIVGLLLVLALVLGIYFSNRRLNRKLQETNEQISMQQKEILAQKERLEQKNQRLEDVLREQEGLVGIVAHDLKAPFNKTLALLKALEEEGGLSPAGRKFVEMIRATGAGAMDLIESLLILSESELEGGGKETQMKELDLGEIVRDRVETFRAAAMEKSIAIHSDLGKVRHEVRSVPQDLERILDNFISNAIKFSPKGGEIWVGVREQGSRPSFYVKDAGPGLTEEDQKKIFKKFQRLSARPTGGESSHGLGLAIVKSLADRLQGRVELESIPGKGATFEFVFSEKGLS